MEKLYDRIDWNNNTTPALNETNLNAMSKAIDDIDDRVIDIADDVLVVVPEILDKYADIEALTTNPPYIGQNGHWWTWDTDTNQYVDSGVDAGVSVTVGTTTTLPAGSDATVTNSGTDTDPILNFGIPQGEAGQDGADGVGVPSGGTTGQVLKKKSGTDYDTEWANESGGGSGGHTIINSAGTSMTQRDGLQFSGLNVTDDSGNDKTVVTLPTPDYVDAQYNSSTTYSKGMTCISGNKRYEYINSTASSGHTPPNATYWSEKSVASEISKWEYIKTININSLSSDQTATGIPMKIFEYSGGSNSLDMTNWKEIGIFVQWWNNTNQTWSPWGNFESAPIYVIKDAGSFNKCGGYSAARSGDNATTLFWSQYTITNEPYIFATFSSGNNANSVTKARIKIYAKR